MGAGAVGRSTQSPAVIRRQVRSPAMVRLARPRGLSKPNSPADLVGSNPYPGSCWAVSPLASRAPASRSGAMRVQQVRFMGCVEPGVARVTVRDANPRRLTMMRVNSWRDWSSVAVTCIVSHHRWRRPNCWRRGCVLARQRRTAGTRRVRDTAVLRSSAASETSVRSSLLWLRNFPDRQNSLTVRGCRLVD